MKKPAHSFPVILSYLLLMALTAGAQTFVPAKPYTEPKLLQDFLCSEVDYPDNALEQGIEGKVIISFVVDPDGSVSQIRIKQRVDPDLDSEAMRLFRMLLWEPAKSFGQPVASEMEFPVDFSIKKYNKHCKLRGYEHTEFPYTPLDSSNFVYEYANTDRRPYPVFDEKGMKLETFITKNIRYPETAFRQSISGKVSLRFVIELSGRSSNIKVINPVGGGCSQEAVRLLQLIRWMPGIKSNKAVRTFMNLDIEFKLPEDSDMKMFDGSPINSN